MPSSEKFYITTTLPYVNASPHIGFALELVQTDIIARYHREILGADVVFNTGTDEHGLKIYRQALSAGKDPQTYVDEYTAQFALLKQALNVSYTNFIRTTDPHHIEAAQEFWRRCEKNGDIYKGIYKTKYCVGCELEKTESDLVDGKCPLHPNLAIEEIEEENYFFRFSKYKKPLLDLYERVPDFVIPDFRFNEIKKFVEAGLKDFSISRLKEKMLWGVPVPGDKLHVMYVWFDALVNYISTLGWPASAEDSASEPGKFEEFWGTKENPNAIQIAGKDNIRQQSAMWQAMLLSAGLPTSRHIIIHGFIGSGGEKMSKSLGNVVDPFEVVEKFGTDALRYWFAREMPMFGDGDFTWDKFKESYNAHLANGLGNLVSRVMKMGEIVGARLPESMIESRVIPRLGNLDNYEIQKAADAIWKQIAQADLYIQQTEPFKKVMTDKEGARKDVIQLLNLLLLIAKQLAPLLPQTSEKILTALKSGRLDAPLFPRVP
jgi:methionyl-tRNA synthetase